MAITAINDRDALLQSAGTRNTDPTAGKYLTLVPTTPIFHVTSSGVGTPASIDITAIPVGIQGTVNFSISSGVLSGTGNKRTLAFSDMQTDSVTITATITDMGQTYTVQQIISKVADGATGGSGTASFVVLTNNGQVFSRANSSSSFSPASLTLTANPFGGTATYQWQYWNGTAWVNVASGGTASTYTVASGDFTDNRTYRVQATINGAVYTDQTTMVQVTGGTNGVNAISGFLTNESATLAAASDGTVTDFSGAGGTFKVYDGVTDKTGASVKYTVASQSGCQASINSSGVYSVSTMSADSATATFQAEYGGVTIQKVLTLAKAKSGTSGSSGNSNATSFLYKWSTVNPGLPAGTAVFTWASGKNTSYSGTDSWYVDAPDNPGTPSIQLWIASKPVSASAGTATTSVTYTSGASLAAYSQNGANGTAGAPGIKSKVVTAYQWTNGPAPTAVGSSTFTWANNDYDTAPSGTPAAWTKAKTNAPALGYTLWEAGVSILDTAGSATTTIDWTTATIVGVGYMSTAGQQGTNGNSAVFAYTIVDGSSLNTTPASFTAQGTNLPTTGTWGETRAWTSQPGVPIAGQSLFQSNGIFNATTNQTTWGVPFLSSFRVGSLSAITANLGAITAGSIDLGTGALSWHVDSTGNMWAGSSTYAAAPFKVSSGGAVVASNLTLTGAGGSTVIDPSGLKAGFEAPGTKNSDIVVGGRNLYPDSGFELGSHPCAEKLNVKTVLFDSHGRGSVDGAKSLYFESNAAGDCYLYMGGGKAAVVPGTQYTLSFLYKSGGTGMSTSTFWRLSDGSHITITPMTMNVQDTWTRHEQVWTCPVGITTIEPRFGFQATSSSWMVVDCIQIEKGNKATTWTPALEDVQAGIDAAAAAGATAGTNLKDASGTVVGNADFLNTYAPVGGNICYNADFGNGLDGWTLVGSGVTVDYCNAAHPGGAGVSWAINAGVGLGSTTMHVYQSGTSQSPAYVEMQSDPIPVVAGKRYCVSAYTGAHRCKVDVFAYMYDANGNNVGVWGANADFNDENAAGGQYLSGYKRQQQCGTALAGVAYVRLVLRKFATKQINNYTDSWMMVGRAQVEEVPVNASTAGPWTPPSPSAGVYASILSKLNKAGSDEINGTIALKSQYALLVGTANDGIFYGSTGIYGRKNGSTTFSIAADGTAIFAGQLSAATGTFAGQLSAATGSFGAVTVAATGSISSGQTGYDAGTGYFWGWSGSTPVMSIGSGNGGPALLWDGTNLIARKITFDALSATISGTLPTAVASGPVTYGSLTVTASGGTVQSYTWTITFTSATGVTTSYGISSGAGTATATFQGNASNMQIQARITCAVLFTDGRTASVSRSHNVTHGTYNQ